MDEVDKLISTLANYISEEIEAGNAYPNMAEDVKALAELVSARAECGQTQKSGTEPTPNKKYDDTVYRQYIEGFLDQGHQMSQRK